MSIALFAIIGALIGAGAGYWIVFSIFCAFKVANWIVTIAKDLNE